MNELFYLAITLLALSIVVLAAKRGIATLMACGVLLTLSTAVMAGKLVPILGYQVSAATCLFAAIFLLSDVTTELHGRKAAFSVLFTMVAADILFLTFGSLVIQIPAATPTPVSDALDKIFTFLPRLMAGGLLAFVISQLLDVLIFARIREATGPKHLWLRNFGSTAISQLVDTVIVWFVAFYGIIPNLWPIIFANYSVKLAASALSIPFCYAAVKLARGGEGHKLD
jgi:queuosine precursor transporter